MDKQLKITHHSLYRIKQRVGVGRNDRYSTALQKAENWITHALKFASRLEDNDGKHVYKSGEYLIVINPVDNVVVTVSYYNPNKYGWKEDLRAAIGRRLDRTIRQYKRQERDMSIAIHEAEIKRLRVFNPNTQRIIGDKIADMHRDLKEVQSTIKAIKDESKRQGVDV